MRIGEYLVREDIDVTREKDGTVKCALRNAWVDSRCELPFLFEDYFLGTVTQEAFGASSMYFLERRSCTGWRLNWGETFYQMF